MERAVTLSHGPAVDVDAIQILSLASESHPAPPAPSQATPVTFAEAERHAILTALGSTHWRISGVGGAADLLGLKPTTLHAKMKRLGIFRPR